MSCSPAGRRWYKKFSKFSIRLLSIKPYVRTISPCSQLIQTFISVFDDSSSRVETGHVLPRHRVPRDYATVLVYGTDPAGSRVSVRLLT